MKSILIICLALFTLTAFSQSSTKAKNKEQRKELKKAKRLIKQSMFSAAIPRKLDNPKIWDRVADNRFECHFLRLAVEIVNNEFVLLEMDGNKRVLAKEFNYKNISAKITQLTLRSKPYLLNKEVLATSNL